jgi:hypothetical protein
MSGLEDVVRTRDDRGAATVEFTGRMVIAAFLVATVAGALAVEPIRDTVAEAVCEVITLGQGDCGSSSSAAVDRTPRQPCVQSADGGSISVRAAVVAVGQTGEEWLIEQLGDGRYRLTRGSSSGGGGTVGVGFKIAGTYNDHAYGVSLGAEATAVALGATGDVYYASTPEELQTIISRARTDAVLDRVTGAGGVVRDIIDWAGGNDAVPTPDQTWYEARGSGDAAAYASWLVAEAHAQGAINAALGARINRDGSGTAYFKADLNAEVAGAMWAADGSTNATTRYLGKAQGTLGAVIEVDYDSSGQPRAMRLVSVVGGQAEWSTRVAGQDASSGPKANSYTQRTVELPLDTAQDRIVAAETLVALGGGGLAVPGLVPPGLTAGLSDAPIRFVRSAHDHGRLWEDGYTYNTTTEVGIGLDAEMIAKLGLDASYSTTQRSGTGQRYFDGTGWRDRPGCVAPK